jgi:hypothetical protein
MCMTDIIDRIDLYLALDAIIDALDWMSEDDFVSKSMKRARVHPNAFVSTSKGEPLFCDVKSWKVAA